MKEVKIDVLAQPKQMTAEEFDAFLEKAKEQNPVKFAIKEQKGEFARFRAKLVGGEIKEPKEPKVAKK